MASRVVKQKVVQILKKGGVGVIPTDTLYGIVGQALNKKAVAKIYYLKKRNPKKPFIILISSINDLKKFGVTLRPAYYSLITKFWPGKISIIFKCQDPKYRYLHRGTKSLAFRLPNDKELIKLIKKTGPLVAPSANTEGGPPAKTIIQAEKYFKNKIDFFLNGGRLNRKPSRLITIEDGRIKSLRR